MIVLHCFVFVLLTLDFRLNNQITMLKLLISVIRELFIPIEINNTLMSVVLVSRNVTLLFSLNNSPTSRKFAIRWNGEGYLYLIVNGLGTF